ncbi:phosphonate metabolism protein/1,5-bisphosphokinase (PRPP-forming) PhnN [Acinetobacter sp. ANC 3813]|uniref:phosphonate metabolism protein/1,5-bisphosphokinase (PRPP-forming) PhnN n=1 Tax=Acinetobacter sp. ANC 3813 TaxID=1977873 RepID=UPI001BB46DF1|nr:phosphonate metabolism protein/1,5-bisphosphokinase (PRPP-forming) PhnN [Acinetobacter sp. ANC 3813]
MSFRQASQSIKLSSAMPKACLFYLMGPSGSGKDSLIQSAKKHFEGNASLFFAHRYITRPIDLNENHISLTPAEFHARQNAGLFALHWQSHDLHYAIGCEVNAWLAQGHHVLVNGSRGHLEQAKSCFPNLVPVLISVSPEILAQRLHARGRESETQIHARLQRAAAFAQTELGLTVIENNAELSQASAKLIQVIEQHLRLPAGQP